MTFNALVVEKDDEGKTSASVQSVSDDRLPEGNVTVAVEYSTVNYKDGLCIGPGGGLVSLGKHPPTEGHCHAWMAISIDEGHYDGEDISGVNIGILADIPGRMGEGQWKVALYVDDSVSYAGYHGIGQIMSGKAGGTTGLLSLLIGEVIGFERTPVIIEKDGPRRAPSRSLPGFSCQP